MEKDVEKVKEDYKTKITELQEKHQHAISENKRKQWVSYGNSVFFLQELKLDIGVFNIAYIAIFINKFKACSFYYKSSIWKDSKTIVSLKYPFL